MKRVLTSLISLVLIISLSGCGDSNHYADSQDTENKQNLVVTQKDTTIQETNEESKGIAESGDGNKVYSYFESLIDINLYSVNDNDDQSVTLMISNDSDMKTNINSDVSIEGDTITLPTAYADLVELRWSCSEEMQNKEIEGMNISANSTLGSANGYNTEFKNNQGKIITVQMMNESEETRLLSECICAGIIVDDNNTSAEISTNGITKEISLKNAVDLLGNPRSLEYRSYSGAITAEFSSGNGNDYRRIVLTYHCENGEAGAMKKLLVSC